MQPSFKKRLGLTATYDREDNGIENYPDPYFGGVCYSVDYQEALADDVIAPFKIAFVGACFSAEEPRTYDEASIKASKYRKRLIDQYDVIDQPFGEFIRQVQRLHATGAGPAARYAGLYLNAFAPRRATLANARNKMRRLSDLAPAIRAAERTILFSHTQDAAEEAVIAVSQSGIQGTVLHSGMDMLSRNRVFASFESGEDELIAAPRLLDEGIDVPAADLAIILASSRSRRQMIQRMGRVLRKKGDGRLARIVIMYVEGTIEDPGEGGHETFLTSLKAPPTPNGTSAPRLVRPTSYVTSTNGTLATDQPLPTRSLRLRVRKPRNCRAPKRNATSTCRSHRAPHVLESGKRLGYRVTDQWPVYSAAV